MKVIDSKILVTVEKNNSATQKIGNMALEIPVGSGQYEVATVVSVGEKIDNLKPGDTLYVYPKCGTSFNHTDGKEYRVISLPDILVVL